MHRSVKSGTWTIACKVGEKTLYYSAVQFIPLGSLTLVSNPLEENVLKKPMLFWTREAAQRVIDVIVLKKKTSKLFFWEPLLIEALVEKGDAPV